MDETTNQDSLYIPRQETYAIYKWDGSIEMYNSIRSYLGDEVCQYDVIVHNGDLLIKDPINKFLIHRMRVDSVYNCIAINLVRMTYTLLTVEEMNTLYRPLGDTGNIGDGMTEQEFIDLMDAKIATSTKQLKETLEILAYTDTQLEERIITVDVLRQNNFTTLNDNINQVNSTLQSDIIELTDTMNERFESTDKAIQSASATAEFNLKTLEDKLTVHIGDIEQDILTITDDIQSINKEIQSVHSAINTLTVDFNHHKEDNTNQFDEIRSSIISASTTYKEKFDSIDMDIKNILDTAMTLDDVKAMSLNDFGGVLNVDKGGTGSTNGIDLASDAVSGLLPIEKGGFNYIQFTPILYPEE